jgi:radical SAM superfamily enzyme YgiQ (UPF0313 family)
VKLLLGFSPFHAPTAPPYGLASLKGGLARAAPAMVVEAADWNLGLFRRWLLSEPPHLCDEHPRHMLGIVCPSLLVRDGRGRQMWEDLTTMPRDRRSAFRYMSAAKLFESFYGELRKYYGTLLGPWVERRSDLDSSFVERLFDSELARVTAAQPDVVGLSVLSEQNLLYALALGRAIDEQIGVPIALGGALMSHLDPAELLRGFPWVSFVFRGEGERSVADFMERWHQGARPGDEAAWRSVPGLSARSRQGTVIEGTAPTPPDFGRLPFADFGDFALRDYLVPEPVLPISTCRGCYWGKCTFCSHTRPFAPGVRVRSAERVVDEMEQQAELHEVRHFLFVDEAMSPKMLRAVSHEITRRQMDVRWGAEGIRVERSLDVGQLEHAHTAGLRWIYVGVETATQRLLDLIDKGIDRRTIDRFIRDCAAAKVVPQLSFIVGLPTTRPEELEQEIDFLRSHPVDFSPFTLLVGSPMHERPELFGVRIEDRAELFETPDAIVHGPQSYFTLEEGGLSPLAAEIAVRRALAAGHPKRRPHLGEVHATVLADLGFFDADSRPDELAPAAARALETLSHRGGQHALHTLGCLEALGDLPTALELAERELKGSGRSDPRVFLHLIALLNELERPDVVVSMCDDDKLDDECIEGALAAELVRAESAVGRPERVLSLVDRTRRCGFVVPWLDAAQARAHEELGNLEAALHAHRRAELKDWYDPTHARGQARCLKALGRDDDARQMTARSVRKEKLLPH